MANVEVQDAEVVAIKVRYHQAPDSTPHHGGSLSHDAVYSAHACEASNPKTLTAKWLAKHKAVLSLVVCNPEGRPTIPVRGVKHGDDPTRDTLQCYWTEA